MGHNVRENGVEDRVSLTQAAFGDGEPVSAYVDCSRAAMPACSGVQLSGCQADERCQYRVADPPIPGATVNSVLDAFGAAQLVKIDCEGCEYLLLPDLLRNRHRIAYVDLECHSRWDVDLEAISLCRAIEDEKGRRFLSPMDAESPCWGTSTSTTRPSVVLRPPRAVGTRSTRTCAVASLDATALFSGTPLPHRVRVSSPLQIVGSPGSVLLYSTVKLAPLHDLRDHVGGHDSRLSWARARLLFSLLDE